MEMRRYLKLWYVSIRKMSKTCLSSLRFSHDAYFSSPLLQQCCPQLKSLHLGWCKDVTNKCLPELQNLRRLKDLDLSLTSITEEGCKHLSKIYELEKLDLTATGLGDEGMKDLLAEDSKRLVRLRLQDLKVGFNSDMTEKSMALLATHMSSLKTLDIRYCEIDKNEAKDSFQVLKRNGTEITGGG